MTPTPPPNPEETIFAQAVALPAGQKKFAEAEPLLLVGYEGLKRCEAAGTLPAENESRIPEAASRLCQLYLGWGKAEQAAEWQRKVVELDRSAGEKKAPAAAAP